MTAEDNAIVLCGIDTPAHVGAGSMKAIVALQRTHENAPSSLCLIAHNVLPDGSKRSAMVRQMVHGREEQTIGIEVPMGEAGEHWVEFSVAECTDEGNVEIFFIPGRPIRVTNPPPQRIQQADAVVLCGVDVCGARWPSMLAVPVCNGTGRVIVAVSRVWEDAPTDFVLTVHDVDNARSAQVNKSIKSCSPETIGLEVPMRHAGTLKLMARVSARYADGSVHQLFQLPVVEVEVPQHEDAMEQAQGSGKEANDGPSPPESNASPSLIEWCHLAPPVSPRARPASPDVLEKNLEFGANGPDIANANMARHKAAIAAQPEGGGPIAVARAPVRVGASTDEVGMAKGEDEADTRSRHVMISYSWQQGKEFVVKVSAGLRERGFDVWRDEDGSNLVMKNMCSAMDVMAKAIEFADVVIIFVSRAYRDSYNCKLEGRYAQVRERSNLVKILFVMMEEDYTPESNSGVDGWLGMLVGDHIWYPGWDTDELERTVADLAKAIHNERDETSIILPPVVLAENDGIVLCGIDTPAHVGAGSMKAIVALQRTHENAPSSLCLIAHNVLPDGSKRSAMVRQMVHGREEQTIGIEVPMGEAGEHWVEFSVAECTDEGNVEIFFIPGRPIRVTNPHPENSCKAYESFSEPELIEVLTEDEDEEAELVSAPVVKEETVWFKVGFLSGAESEALVIRRLPVVLGVDDKGRHVEAFHTVDQAIMRAFVTELDPSVKPSLCYTDEYGAELPVMSDSDVAAALRAPSKGGVVRLALRQ